MIFTFDFKYFGVGLIFIFEEVLRIYIFISCRIHSKFKDSKRRKRRSWILLEICSRESQKRRRRIYSVYL